jgi:hypothetical protein
MRLYWNLTKTHLEANGNVSSGQTNTNMARIERSLQFKAIETSDLITHQEAGKRGNPLPKDRGG